MSYAQIEKALRWSAVVVLLVGLTASFLIWRAQDRIDRGLVQGPASDPEILLSPLDSRQQTRELELYGGKTGVLMEEAKGLLHGKPLAKTVAVVTVVLSAGLVFVSVRWPD